MTMKHRIFLLFLLMFTFLGIAQNNKSFSKKESKAEKKARIEQTTDSLLNTRNYSVEVHTAFPRGWQAIQLSSLYYLSIKGDSVEVDLPYYGRAYNVSYPLQDGGIEINATVTNYQHVKKRNHAQITFDARNEFDLYRFTMTISPGGYASIEVNSNNRQGIGFSGIIDPFPQ